MIRIWGKLLKNNKMIDNFIYENEEEFVIPNFEKYIQEICYHFDMPTPMILVKHIKNFILFNSANFSKDDFVEKVPFDKFIIENVKPE